MIGKIGLGIVAIVVVAVLMVGYVVPYGLEGDNPTASVGIYLQKADGTGDVLSASVDIGQPKNTLAFKRPDIPFRSLQTFEKTVAVLPETQYVLWLDFTFDYTGERIASYETITVSIVARSGDYMIFNSQMLSETTLPAGVQRATDNNTLYMTGPLPVGEPPMEYGMNPSDPFVGANILVSTDGDYKVICGMAQTALWEEGFAWLPDTLLRPAAIGIEGITIDCTVTIYGTANDGTPVVGTVTATLVLHADIGAAEPSGGGISVSITDMGAGIREGDY